MRRHILFIPLLLLSSLCIAAGLPRTALVAPKKEAESKVTFPLGTATPSAVCGECHAAIYREFAHGFGSDINRKSIPHAVVAGKTQLTPPAAVSATATSHAVAGKDPYPRHAREAEAGGSSCNVCHFPDAFNLPQLDAVELSKPPARAKGLEEGGLTCASCHLTPEGKIRGPYNLNAPHEVYPDVRMKTSLMCAYCHSLGKRLPGKQTQTFLEWRDDYFRKGLGSQNCQDCHMPRTLRKLAENYPLPERVVARHLWTGGKSLQRLTSALSQVIIQPAADKAAFEFHVINIGAGHSVPTGSNRHAIYLKAEAVDGKGKITASREWLFAPWYDARPDDKAFLEADKDRPGAKSAMQADAQGPHERIIDPGEERILSWAPHLEPGQYTIRSRLVYDQNRYNDNHIPEDQTVFSTTTLGVTVGRGE
jgi:hypothetical protein